MPVDASQVTFSPKDPTRYLTTPSEVDDALDQLADVSTSALTTTDNAIPRADGITGRWQDGQTIEALVRRADDALYQAKQQGRNRVMSFQGTE